MNLIRNNFGLKFSWFLILAILFLVFSVTLPKINAQVTCNPCSLWSSSNTPQVASWGDNGSVELGVKFRASTNGQITGIKFYKGSNNTGTHIGSLWSRTGQRLAQATFTNETASGWQQITFATPVAITANTTYIASYFAPIGRYSVTRPYFGSSYTNGPLTALQDGLDGGNGVYNYSATSTFPSLTYRSTNYWVDVIFTPATGPPDTQAPTVSITNPAGGSTVSGTTAIAANASDNIGVAGVQFQIDGVNLGSEDTTSPYGTTWISNTATNGTRTITAVARDAAGNLGSSQIIVTVYNPPVLTITQPVDGASISGTTVNVTYTKSGDLTEANHAHFRLDGGSTAMDMDFDGLYTFTNVPTGTHTLIGIIARADHSEIAGSEDSVNFTTTTPDTISPTVSLTSPSNNTTVSGTISVTADANDNVGVAGVQFLLDGANLGSEDTSAPFAFSWNTSSAANGTHTLTARAQDAALNQTTSSPITVTVNNVDPRSQVGEWGPVLNWPLVAIHGSVLPNGNVLVWDDDHDTGTVTNARVWNPQTGNFTTVTENSLLFCAGHAFLSDGRLLVSGGAEGINEGNIFDYQTNTWFRTPNMQYRRWYPTATELADGRVVSLSGHIQPNVSYADNPEIYSPITNSWTTMTTNTGSMHEPQYPANFLQADGNIFVISQSNIVSTSGTTHMLNVGSQTWTNIGPIGPNLSYGTSVMYRPGKILFTGGGNNYTDTNSVGNTALIDLNQPGPTWRMSNPMAYGRYQHNMVILPNGEVLTVGGATNITLDTNTGVLAAEMWNPITEAWTAMASMQTPRLYHSIALLLPDGRVMVAGGGRFLPSVINRFNAEIYSPPYLFKGPRPTISNAPATAIYGSTIAVQTPDAANIAKVTLAGLETITHTMNMNSHFMELPFTADVNGLNVQIPTNPNVAPPGFYMLFIVNGNGVPSVASIMRIGQPPDTEAPTTPGNLTALAAIGSATLTWDASSDNVGVLNYNVHRSTTASFTPDSANRIAQPSTTSYVNVGLAAGTYYYKVTAQDGAGNLSQPSNEVSVNISQGTTSTLGYTSIAPNPDTGMSNAMTATRFIMGSTGGTVATMSVYVNGVDPTPNNQFQVAIYSDNNNRPGNLLAQSSSFTLTANSWNSASISTNLSANTPYWLVYNSNASNPTSNNMRRDQGSTNQTCYQMQNFGSWPATFSSAGCANNQWNIYATYALIGGPPPSPTPTPTPTPTPLPTPSPTPAPTPPPGSTATLGYTSIAPFTEIFMSNRLNGTRFVMGASGGNVTSMSVYVDGVSGAPNNQYQVAIYSDVNLRPGAVIAQSTSGTLVANSWSTRPISATLLANTPYWLAYNTNGTSSSLNNLRLDNGATDQTCISFPSTFGNWPSFSVKECGAGIYGLYATYTPIP